MEPLSKILRQTVELLAKAGQYVDVPEWAFTRGYQNEAEREQLKKVLTGRGKIKPADWSRLVKNGDRRKTLEYLSDRKDLTAEQAAQIAKRYEGNGHAEIDRVADRIVPLLTGNDRQDLQKDVLLNSQPADRYRQANILNHTKFINSISGQVLFDLATNHDTVVPERTWEAVSKKSNHMDHGLIAEMLKNPHPEAALSLISNGKIKTAQQAAEALAHPAATVRSTILERGNNIYRFGQEHNLITPPMADAALRNDPDMGVKEAAIPSATPEAAAWAMDQHGDKGPIAQAAMRRLSSDGMQPTHIEKATRLLDQYDRGSANSIARLLEGNLDVTPQQIDRILNSRNVDSYGKRNFVNHPNVTTENLKTALIHPELADRVAAREDTPEDLLMLAHQVGKETQNGSVADALSRNPNTPASIINELTEHPDLGIRANALEHSRAGGQAIDKQLASQDPNHRILPSQNAGATSEQIARGIKDPIKEVRAAWMKNPNVGPEHLATLIRDRAPTLRLEAVTHPSMTTALLSQALGKEKSEDVIGRILRHPNINPDALRAAIKPNADYSNIRAAEVAMSNSSLPVADVIDAMRQWNKVSRTDPGLISTRNRISGHALALHQDATTDQKNAMIDFAAQPGGVVDVLARKGTRLPVEVIDHAIESAQKNHMYEDARILLDRRRSDHNTPIDETTAGRWYANLQPTVTVDDPNVPDGQAIRQREDKSEARASLLESNVPESLLIHALPKEQDNRNQKVNILKNPNGGAGLWNHIKASGKDENIGYAINNSEGMARHITTKDLEDVFPKGGIHTQTSILARPDVSVKLLQMGAKSPHRHVSEMAEQQLSLHHPDEFNTGLLGHERVEIHPAVEKLKHIKGLVEQAGGNVHKKDLEGLGVKGIPGQLLNGTGHLTAQGIEKHIQSLPKVAYNVSHETWIGAQRHDKTKPQDVVQVNLTNDQVSQLKQQGVYDIFKKLNHDSKYSGHPVKAHTLGWARVDMSHPDHAHIDEIQSDLGRATINKIEEAKQRGKVNPEQADQAAEGMRKVIKILSGPFKNINHAIFGAVHESLRNKGIKTTSMDTLPDQAKQSGMREQDVGGQEKALPGHMQHTYGQMPSDAGYEEKTKESVMPGHQSAEQTAQVRRLVKSLLKLRGTLGTATFGRHDQAPGTNAAGPKLMPAKPTRPEQHIRADTQTHQDFRYELGKALIRTVAALKKKHETDQT